MKMIFKKNQPKRASLRASAERRESEEYFRPFDKVAYAAVLEIMAKLSSRISPEAVTRTYRAAMGW